MHAPTFRNCYHEVVDAKHPLWTYFREVRAAVNAANQGRASQPYASGTFMVCALADDIELTISDVSEEDAVLIASELEAMGVTSVVRGSVICSHCKGRVPQQAYCVQCREKLG